MLLSWTIFLLCNSLNISKNRHDFWDSCTEILWEWHTQSITQVNIKSYKLISTWRKDIGCYNRGEGWSDGSEVRNTGWWRPVFNSQRLHDGSQTSVTPLPKDHVGTRYTRGAQTHKQAKDPYTYNKNWPQRKKIKAFKRAHDLVESSKSRRLLTWDCSSSLLLNSLVFQNLNSLPEK